jgi:MFS transporter, DHA2 family, multidrug resistance protein
VSTEGIARSPHPVAEPWRPAFNPWLITVVVSLAAFMEVLDTSIANVALPHIAGNLGASNDESTWVLTSYLVANAIVLPISGWLVELFGRKRLFMVCIALFTLGSAFCAMAPTLGVLLVARVLQGAFGGGLQPMAQAILADSFPPERRGLAFSAYGVTAVCAPALGPTLGGWITDSYSWRWIFWINLPVGLLALALVLRLVEDPPYLTYRRQSRMRVDYIGFALLALGVGALQIMLDKGQEDDWFGSRFIFTLAVVAAVCLTALIVYEWFHPDPLIEVRLFTDRNFATANLMMFMVGAVSFATTVMLPQLLQTLMGYTAQTAGMVLSVGALFLLVEMPIVGRLITVFQTRYLIAFGWLLLAGTMYLSTQQLDLAVSFESVTWLRVLQYAPIPFIFVPTTTAAYVGIPAEKSNTVAGLVNFMRNMGSGVGTSMVTTLIARQSQFHQAHLVSRVAEDNPAFQAQLSDLVQRLADAGLGAYEAQRQAYTRFYEMVQSQAQTLAYIDTFWTLTAGATVMLGLAFILRRNNPRAGGHVVVH